MSEVRDKIILLGAGAYQPRSLILDLFALAKSNEQQLEQQYTLMLSNARRDEADSIRLFAESVIFDGRVCINMRQMDLLAFLDFGRYLNTYESADVDVAFSKKSVTDILREVLEAFYERRIVFDRFFSRGNEFYYGALSIGGAGATYYGNFCVVLKDERFEASTDVAYLRSDSLLEYMEAGPAVNIRAIGEDAATHSHKQYLASLKHARTIPRLGSSEWPRMLCSATDYMEAIFTGEVSPKDSEAVRVPGVDFRRLFNLAFDENRRNLDVAERYEAQSFVMVLRHLKELGLPLQEVEL